LHTILLGLSIVIVDQPADEQIVSLRAWTSLPPLVAAVMTPPEYRPYSALYVPVRTRNSRKHLDAEQVAGGAARSVGLIINIGTV